MARYGYMLLDATDPDVNRQALQLDSIGGFDRLFIDRVQDGGSAAAQEGCRQQRERLLGLLQADDVILVAALDRWCDHLRDFLETMQIVEKTNADLFILAEGLDTRSQVGRQAIRLLKAFDHLDFLYQSSRKKAGIEAARREGRRIGRPQVAIPPGFRDICRQWAAGLISGPEAARRSGLRNTSFYKKAAELGFRPARRKRSDK